MNAQSPVSTPAVSDHRPGATFLRHTLWANAAFSLLAGTAFALFGPRLAAWAGVPEGGLAVRLVGVGLAAFGLGLVSLARRKPLPETAIRLVLLADLAWVAGSVYVVLAQPFGLNHSGRIGVAVVSDTVLLLAILEWIGLRRLTRHGARD